MKQTIKLVVNIKKNRDNELGHFLDALFALRCIQLAGMLHHNY